jgi:hypothetical protein
MTVVQVILMCAARVPLRVLKVLLLPPTHSTPAKSLTDFEDSSVTVSPNHELAAAFAIESSAVCTTGTEQWRISVEYEHPLWEGVAAQRTFESTVSIGSPQSAYSISVVAPDTATVGMACDVRVTIRRTAHPLPEPSFSVQPKSQTQLQVKVRDPRLWVVSGFRRRTVQLPDTQSDPPLECPVRLVPLQAGYLPLPSFQLNGKIGKETAWSTGHITVLPECHSFLSCRRDTGERMQHDQEESSRAADAVAATVAVREAPLMLAPKPTNPVPIPPQLRPQ